MCFGPESAPKLEMKYGKEKKQGDKSRFEPYFRQSDATVFQNGTICSTDRCIGSAAIQCLLFVLSCDAVVDSDVSGSHGGLAVGGLCFAERFV